MHQQFQLLLEQPVSPTRGAPEPGQVTATTSPPAPLLPDAAGTCNAGEHYTAAHKHTSVAGMLSEQYCIHKGTFVWRVTAH